jgi:hypothetical protein
MSENRLPLDDARLTAYALGELDAETAAEIEALLASSPAAREAFDEIREVANLLTSELSREPTPLLTESQRQSILAMAFAEDRHFKTKSAESSPPAGSHDKSTAIDPAALTVTLPASQIPRRRWIARFASLATITATVAVALLITPPSRPPERWTDAARACLVALSPWTESRENRCRQFHRRSPALRTVFSRAPMRRSKLPADRQTQQQRTPPCSFWNMTLTLRNLRLI